MCMTLEGVVLTWVVLRRLCESVEGMIEEVEGLEEVVEGMVEEEEEEDVSSSSSSRPLFVPPPLSSFVSLVVGGVVEVVGGSWVSEGADSVLRNMKMKREW